MKRQFFSGSTLEQAVLAAAREFGLDHDRVAYKVRDKRHGFLKIRRRVVIEVDPESPLRQEAPESRTDSSRASRRSSRDDAPFRDDSDLAESDSGAEGSDEPDWDDGYDESEDDGEDDLDDDWDDEATGDPEGGTEEDAEDEQDAPEDELAAVERAAREVLRFLRLECDLEVAESDDGIFQVEVSGPDGEVLVAQEGRLLHAMDYLLPRLVRGLFGDAVPCKVDCEGYRETREEELRDLADEVAEEVAESGETRLLKPLSPADRRIIHMALADHPEVETESEGEGYFKRIRISLIE